MKPSPFDHSLTAAEETKTVFGESCYRRGYQQGYYQAREDYVRGGRLDRCQTFDEQIRLAALANWRNKDHGGYAEPPPPALCDNCNAILYSCECTRDGE